MSFTLGISLGCTIPSMFKPFFLSLLLCPNKWRLKAFLYFTFPDPVTLKRFLAPEFVLTLGIALKFGRAKIALLPNSTTVN